jgi:hypothetical protein
VKVVFSLASRNRFWLGMMISVSTTFCSASIALVGLAHALRALELEGFRDDADGQHAKLARGLRDDRRRAGAGAAAHPGGDEGTCARRRGDRRSPRSILRRRRTDGGPRTRAQPLGHFRPIWMRPRRLGLRERLRIGVRDDELAALKALAIMLLTALPPAPPTPNTVMRGLRSPCSGMGDSVSSLCPPVVCPVLEKRLIFFWSSASVMAETLSFARVTRKKQEPAKYAGGMLARTDAYPHWRCILRLPVVAEPPHRPLQRCGPGTVGRGLEIPPFVLRMRGKQRSPTQAESPVPQADCGRPCTRSGRPSRTCCPGCGWPAVEARQLARPPVSTIRWLGRWSKPAASSRARTSSRISSIRGRITPISSDRDTVRRSWCHRRSRFASR